MAWTEIAGVKWEYSNSPNTDKMMDDTYDYDKDSGHVAGIRTNSDGTEIYVLCRQMNRIDGIGYGELNKTAIEG